MSRYRIGVHEFRADFQGETSGNLSLTKRPDAIAFENHTAFSLGPVAIGDVSQDIVNFSWYIRADNAGKAVYIARQTDDNTGWLPEVELFTFIGVDIEEIDLAFEQAGRPLVCASRKTGAGGAEEVWIYWFSPTTSAFEFDFFGEGRTPRCLIDNPLDITDSDIMIFYINDTIGGVCYRQQRDRYGIEYPTPFLQGAEASPGVFLPTSDRLYVEDVIRTTDNRLSVLCTAHEGGRYNFRTLASAMYPFFPPQAEMAQPNALWEGGSIDFALVIISDPSDAPPLFPDVYAYWNESQIGEPAAVLQSGDLVILVFPPIVYDSGTFQEDNLKEPNTTLQSGILASIIILYDAGTFQEDNIKEPSQTLQSGSLVTYIFVYDSTVTPSPEDLIKEPSPTLQSGSLV